jgi:REP element-mobilizing transposase RayT
MRQGRLKAPDHHPVAYYHCLSRVVDRQRVLGPREKDHFVSLMREYEAFCGVRVATFTVMSNHFHILLEVQRPPPIPLTDEDLLQRVEGLSNRTGRGNTRQRLEQLRQQGQDKAAEELREKIFARMWDVSGFMKLLKQRFTQWFNREHGRKGTLWEERFKSVLVEGAGAALATMAAYIDLNSVRANLGDDPKSYRWCGYAEAMAGNPRARIGLRIVVAGGHRVAPETLSLDESLMKYRVWLFGQGAQDEGTDAEGRPLRTGIPLETVAAVIAARGRVSPAEYMRLRVRYYADGAVLGTREFVNGVFQSLRKRFGPKRQDGARRMRGVESQELYTLRDLRLRVVG